MEICAGLFCKQALHWRAAEDRTPIDGPLRGASAGEIPVLSERLLQMVENGL